MSKQDYIEVQIPKRMADEIESLGWFKKGYKDLEEFVTDATRHELERLFRKEKEG